MVKACPLGERFDVSLRNEMRVECDLRDRHNASGRERSKTARQCGIAIGNLAEDVSKYHDVEVAWRCRDRGVTNNRDDVGKASAR